MVFFGSPLVDIIADVDDKFLKKYQLDNDTAYGINEDNGKIFDDLKERSWIQVGGSVTNTVRTVRKLRDSPNIKYLGTIGDDFYGEFIKNKLYEEGLGENLTCIHGNTGKVAVLLNNKKRTLITDLGVSQFFSIDDKALNEISENTIVYLSGFFISVSSETITKIIAKNPTIIFNLGASFLCSKFPKEMTLLYKHSSIIFGNESEHRAFAQIFNISGRNLSDVIQSTNRAINNQSRVVIATRGGGAVLVVQNNDWSEFECEDLDAKIVDTNGAGDALVGGFLAKYVDGDSVANCVKCGIKVAGKIIQNLGFKLDCVDQ